MVRPTIMFQPGWSHEAPSAELTEDPETGETFKAQPVVTAGHGLIQQPLWTGFQEITSTSVTDERVVMFHPDSGAEAFRISADDTFFDPQGRCWQAITEGIDRRIPGKPVAYFACSVRRAKEKDRG